jgi:hypothetical protein
VLARELLNAAVTSFQRDWAARRRRSSTARRSAARFADERVLSLLAPRQVIMKELVQFGI